MSTTTIILIVVCSVCGLFFLWAVKNGNNIKFKKKEGKSKNPKDKFKDVIPKEKPEKKEKQKPEKIRKTVLDEKSGKVESPTNKVVKVTKEDFKTNDIELPKTFTEKSEENKSRTDNIDDKFNLDDFDLEKEMEALGIKPPKFNSAPTFVDESDNFGASMINPYVMQEDQFVDNFNYASNFKDEEFDFPKQEKKDGEFVNQSLEERFIKVFGDTAFVEDKATREVIIGEIVSTNRSKTNRESRARRNKFLN